MEDQANKTLFEVVPQKNTTLDDIAGVIGFTPTLRLAAWYGNGNNLFVPPTVEDSHVLVRLLGRQAAERLAEAFGHEHLAIPRLASYEEDERRRRVATMLEKGFSTREVSRLERMSERRVQQMCRELEMSGLIAPVGPAKSANENLARKPRGRKRK